MRVAAEALLSTVGEWIRCRESRRSCRPLRLSGLSRNLHRRLGLVDVVALSLGSCRGPRGILFPLLRNRLRMIDNLRSLHGCCSCRIGCLHPLGLEYLELGVY